MKKTILVLVICLLISSSTAFAGQLETFEVMAAVSINGHREYMDTRVYKLNSSSPKPLIILTHGSPPTRERQRAYKNDLFDDIAETFAYEGYVVVVVLRGGFGKTSFGYQEEVKQNNGWTDVYAANMEAAYQLQEVIEYYKSEKYVDKTKIYAMGASTGGQSVVALSTLNISGLKGVVNFSGGRGSNMPYLFNSMVDAMTKYGKMSKVPNLWLYASNDTFFPPDIANRMGHAFINNGGVLQYEMLPPLSEEGHNLVFMKKYWYGIVKEFFIALN